MHLIVQQHCIAADALVGSCLPPLVHDLPRSRLPSNPYLRVSQAATTWPCASVLATLTILELERGNLSPLRSVTIQPDLDHSQAATVPASRSSQPPRSWPRRSLYATSQPALTGGSGTFDDWVWTTGRTARGALSIIQMASSSENSATEPTLKCKSPLARRTCRGLRTSSFTTQQPPHQKEGGFERHDRHDRHFRLYSVRLHVIPRASSHRHERHSHRHRSWYRHGYRHR